MAREAVSYAKWKRNWVESNASPAKSMQLVIVGDSTVCNYPDNEPTRGWGPVRPIRAHSDSTQDEWSLLTSRVPAKYSVPGTEFEMVVPDAHLQWLRGEE